MSSTQGAADFNGNHGISLFIFIITGLVTWYASLLINQKHQPLGVIAPTVDQSIAIVFYVLAGALYWGKLYFVFSTKK